MLTCHPQVTREGHLEPAAERGAVDRGERGHGQALERAERRGEAVGAAGFLGVPGWDWVIGRDCEEPGEGVFAAGDSFLGRVGRLGLGLKSVGAPFFAISPVV